MTALKSRVTIADEPAAASLAVEGAASAGAEAGAMAYRATSRAFRAWLQDRHYAEASTRVYTEYVERVSAHLDTAGMLLADATLDDLYDFWTTLPTSSSSRNQCRKALIAYYRSIGRKRGEPADELPALPEPHRLPRPVDDDGYRALIAAAHDLGGIHRVLGLTLAYTGCRFNELRTARWDQFELHSTQPVWYVSGKGSKRRGQKTRQVPVRELLAVVLTAWRQECGSTVYLFPSGRSTAGVLSPSTLRKLLYELSGHAGLERIVAHRYRHTVGTVALATSHDLRAVQELLGHADSRTTQQYTQVAAGRLQDLVDGLPE